MLWRWLLSRTVRQASELHKHVWKLLSAQRDVLSPASVASVEAALADLKAALKTGATKPVVVTAMENVEKAATNTRTGLKPYPNHAIRENVEVILVAVAVAMGIRTFFFQPFKIPTGSMQPTLYGIHFYDLKKDPTAHVPQGLVAQWERLILGTFYITLVADAECQLAEFGPVEHVSKFINKQRVTLRLTRTGELISKTVWFAPDDGLESLPRHKDLTDGQYFQLQPGQVFHPGEYIFKLKEVAGDHLFVNRITYNLRPPKRGEIVVFETKGIPDLPQDQFYIKRLVALSGEHVRIGDDRHLLIDGHRLDATTPHFEKVYSFTGPPQDSHYSGHVNQRAARFPMPNFPDEAAEFTVQPGHYMVMGDNTMNSSDSRVWGDFSRTNVIGQSCFVYWPFGERFGWGHR